MSLHKINTTQIEAQWIDSVTEQIRSERPLVQCITNSVTVNDCANALLAVGASPTMAHHPEEVDEIQRACNALVCNMGATYDFEAMEIAVRTAVQNGHPIVIDPVGVGGSSFRRAEVYRLLHIAAGKTPLCIRGNGAEIKALLLDDFTAAGVDEPNDPSDLISEKEQQAVLLARKYHCLVVSSGVEDYISDGDCIYVNRSGSRYMSRVTGCGCMLSCLLGAALGAISRPNTNSESQSPAKTLAAICYVYGKKAEHAEQKSQNGGTMTFRTCFIDLLSGALAGSSD